MSRTTCCVVIRREEINIINSLFLFLNVRCQYKFFNIIDIILLFVFLLIFVLFIAFVDFLRLRFLSSFSFCSFIVSACLSAFP